MTESQLATLEIFEDLYRANMRGSVFELEGCMQSIELLKKPDGRNKHGYLAQEALRLEMINSIIRLEERLKVLRTRFESLPELPGKKSEVESA